MQSITSYLILTEKSADRKWQEEVTISANKWHSDKAPAFSTRVQHSTLGWSGDVHRVGQEKPDKNIMQARACVGILCAKNALSIKAPWQESRAIVCRGYTKKHFKTIIKHDGRVVVCSVSPTKCMQSLPEHLLYWTCHRSNCSKVASCQGCLWPCTNCNAHLKLSRTNGSVWQHNLFGLCALGAS